MYYSIFRNNELVVSVKPDDTSELVQKKQTEDYIRLNFSLDSFIDIQIGDYISFAKTEQLYRLNKKPRVVETPRDYRYECIFEGSIHELKKTKVFLTTNKDGGGYYKDYKFPLTGNAETFLSFIVDNLNRTGEGYTVGKFKSTGTATIEFNNWTAFESCVQLSNELGFDWYLNGKELNFDEKGYNTAYTFQSGRKNGFLSLTRTRVDNANLETVVYGYGSTKNLPPRIADEGITYDSPLLTENRLAFVGVDGESKLEANVDKYGVIEAVKEFDIKPERIGEVTAIDSENFLVFYDDTIDFDIEQQKLPGIKPKVIFLDGQLIGLTFDIAYDHATHQITMDTFNDETGEYPNEVIKAAVGDKYVFVDIIMPDSYIVEAQTRLQAATQQYLDDQSDALDLYEGIVDESFVEENEIVLDLGDIIRVVSGIFLIDNLYEIKELTQKVTQPSKYNIKFGNILPKSLLALLQQVQFNNEQSIYNIQKTTLTTNQVTNQITNITEQAVEWETL